MDRRGRQPKRLDPLRNFGAQLAGALLLRGVRQPGRRPDIRFLDGAELEALLRATPHDLMGPTEHALYLTAALTGLRQGELLALRWQDVDWTAGVVRVRRSYTRGEFGAPKSRRSSRAVPMADRVAGEIYADYAPDPSQGAAFAQRAFGTVTEPPCAGSGSRC